MSKLTYLDIETTPNEGYFWRCGYKINIQPNNISRERAMICAAWAHDDGKIEVADDLILWDNGVIDDSLIVKKLAEAVEDSTILVHHNGDKFDIKWIRSRALTHGINNVPRWASFDTLKSVRANIQLPSNRLGDIGRYFGLSEKIKTDPDLWKNIVFGDNSRMQEMIDYCEQDVILLEQVYHKIKGVVPLKTHVGVTGMREKWSCPACGSEKVVVKSHTNCTSATGVRKHQMHCKEKECGRYYHISGLVYTNYLKQTRLRKK